MNGQINAEFYCDDDFCCQMRMGVQVSKITNEQLVKMANKNI